MARVTVEDCLKNVKNRFELVIVAAKRARQLMRGKEPKVEWDNDKSTVVALREIAAGYVDVDSHEPREEEIMVAIDLTVVESKTIDIDEDDQDDNLQVDASEQNQEQDEEQDQEEHPQQPSEGEQL